MKCKIQLNRPIANSRLNMIQILLILFVINICFHIHFSKKIHLKKNSIPQREDIITQEKSMHTEPLITDRAAHQEKVDKANNSQVKDYYTPDALDMSRLNYLGNIISHLRSGVIKKSMENDLLMDTNKQLEKNYDQFNNQYIFHQSKIDSSITNIGVLDSVKSSYARQLTKLKEGNMKLHEMNNYFEKINSEIENKSQTIQNYQQKVKKDIHKYNEEKSQLQSQLEEKIKKLETTKNEYRNDITSKIQLIESIKKSFTGLAREEIKLKKTKRRAHELELQIKSEENSEKLLSLEIEHIKSTNLVQVQKIEELKQEIERSTMLAKYMNEDIRELEDKLSTIDNENTQSQIEYELKKNELEDKLFKLKEEMKNEENLNHEEKEKYIEIEKDLKNRISSLSLQNINSMYKFKQRPENLSRVPPEEEALKQQIISILKNLNQ